MLKNILVPLDGSALAEQALGYATELSVPTAAHLVLVRVAYSHTLAGVDPRERQEGAIAEAEAYLAEIAGALEARGYDCETCVPYGHPTESIVEEARLRKADLIVMSTHGRTGPGHVLFGSVAESVVARATVPVLVTRAWLPPQRLPFLPDQPIFVVPLDGSAFAESAIEPAVGLADDLGAAVLLMRGVADHTLESDALEYLQGVEARLAEAYPDLSVLTEVRTANPTHAIEDAFRENGASLVFMATHGHGGIARHVIKESQAPVVLIRPVAHVLA